MKPSSPFPFLVQVFRLRDDKKKVKKSDHIHICINELGALDKLRQHLNNDNMPMNMSNSRSCNRIVCKVNKPERHPNSKLDSVGEVEKVDIIEKHTKS